jgi:hypothetical protein
MIRALAAASTIVLCAGQARADLTLRHSIDLKFAPSMPPKVAEQARKQMEWMPAGGSTVWVKGDKVATTLGAMKGITEYARSEVAILIPATRQYTTVSLAEYASKILAAEKMPELPPGERGVFDSMAVDVQSGKTGQIGLVHGIQGEKYLMTVSMGPLGAANAAGGMKLEVRSYFPT